MSWPRKVKGQPCRVNAGLPRSNENYTKSREHCSSYPRPSAKKSVSKRSRPSFRASVGPTAETAGGAQPAHGIVDGLFERPRTELQLPFGLDAADSPPLGQRFQAFAGEVQGLAAQAPINIAEHCGGLRRPHRHNDARRCDPD